MIGRKAPSSASKRSDNPSPPHRRQSSIARVKLNSPTGILFPHPLSWWRSRAADDFKKIDVFIARHFLQKSAIIGEPHWFLAAAGDSAVAVGVALRALKEGGNTQVSLDVAMTAVLCVALEGDPTAVVLMATALKRRSETDPPCSHLSDGWLKFDRCPSVSPLKLRRGN